MRKLTLCCFATTALLALPLTVQASPAGVMTHAAGLHPALGAGHVILVADDQKPADPNQSAGDNKPTGDRKETATNKPKSKRKSARQKTPSKNQIMKQIKQHVPKEYQGYLQQGAGGAGAGGAGAGGAGGGYGGYGR